MECGSIAGHVGRLERFAGRAIYTGSVIFQDEIRILLLEPGSAIDDPIVCNLEVASLASKPAYEALSYTWDSPVAGITLQNEDIKLCGEPMEIKGNLSYALKRLRLPKACRKLWVDALCIDQSNHAERSHQVSIMPRIYRNAKVVQVWLGEDSGDAKISIAYLQNVYRLRAYVQSLSAARSNISDAANIGKIHNLLFGPRTKLGKYIRRTHNHETLRFRWSAARANFKEEAQKGPYSWTQYYILDFELRSPESMLIYQMLRHLFQRSYFSRRWVLHELHQARRADVLCGSEMIRWQEMQAAFEIHRTISSAATYFTFKLNYPALWFGLAIHQGRAKGIPRLLKLLNDVKETKCHDPRDIIYALLGLVRQTCLQPDYSLSISETWIAVAKAGIREGLAVEMISTAASQMTEPSRCSGLPSWVPDFQIPTYLLESNQLQFDAFVDAENRVTCNLSCFGEVVFYNGWALLKEWVNDAVIEEVMAASKGSKEAIIQYYTEDRLPLPSGIPFVMAQFDLLDGDLLCKGIKGGRDFAIRTLPLDGPVEANNAQEWNVLGCVDGSPWSRSEQISRIRRLKLV